MSGIVTSANGLVARKADTAYLRLSGRGKGWDWGGGGELINLFLPLGWALIRDGC